MILVGPRNAGVPIGRSAVFSCNVSAEPPPVITWRFNGVEITAGSKYTVMATAGETMTTLSVLTINNLTVSDNGDYSCSAENDHGNETSTANLIVQSKLLMFFSAI